MKQFRYFYWLDIGRRESLIPPGRESSALANFCARTFFFLDGVYYFYNQFLRERRENITSFNLFLVVFSSRAFYLARN